MEKFRFHHAVNRKLKTIIRNKAIKKINDIITFTVVKNFYMGRNA
jgi:hypothetical protein